MTSTVKHLIRNAFLEDAPQGDITSRYFGDPFKKARAKIVAKQNGVLAGLMIAESCFKTVDKKLGFKKLKKDGALLKTGDVVAVLEGRLNSILLGERTALNFLQFMSGIATATGELVSKIKKTKTKVLDTRKTVPGLRVLSKYAVVCGGGRNHRLNLSEMVLIKDNHLAEQSMAELTRRIQKFRAQHKKIKLEIEAENLTQVASFLKLPVDIIMLDNMSLVDMKKAAALRRQLQPGIKLEASGNINKQNILAVAKTGVDFISVGAITHSAPAFDFSLRVTK